MSRFVLGPATIAFGDGSENFGRIAIDHGRIERVLAGNGASDLLLPPGTIVAPGMIDVHTNGAGDRSFNRDQGAAVHAASNAYARAGTTAFLATIMTAPWDSMLHAASEVAEAAHELEERGTLGARCLGIHFEGPFLNPKFRRVHRQEWLLPATAERAHALVESARGALLMVTMAPEMDGVSDLARWFVEQNVVCSAGHTSARYREGMLAIGLGFRSLTHAFNAMPPLDHRDPSLLAAFIQDERTAVQVICDGHHVSPVMIDLVHRTLGERLVLATDNMPSDEGYRLSGGVVRAEDGTIAGSALSMDQAVRNYMQYTQTPFARAILHATLAPARLVCHDDEIGRIANGLRADFSIWNARHEVIGTMVGGRIVYGDDIFTKAPAQAS